MSAEHTVMASNAGAVVGGVIGVLSCVVLDREVRRQEEDHRPALSKSHLERIDEGREGELTHSPRKEDPTQNQADPKEESTLNPGSERCLVGSLGRPEQIPPIDPGCRHRQCRQPERHRTPGNQQILQAPITNLPRRQPAEQQK
jgi:hypothetical protein